MKDIQRKDYKKNKENTKEAIANDKTMLEKQKEGSRNEKPYEGMDDGTQITVNRLRDMNNDL